MEHYIARIFRPTDDCTYNFYGVSIHEGMELCIEYAGGSSEECEWKLNKGILELKTPIFTINPTFITIGLNIKTK